MEAFTELRVQEMVSTICQYIEKEALRVYNSNQPWALKAWLYSYLSEDAVKGQDAEALAEALVSPVIEWQERDFDPISHYRDILDIEGLRPRTKETYLSTACRMVVKLGRKTHYTSDEIIEYLKWARKHYPPNTSSYQHECMRVRRFLRSLPGNKDGELPMKMPKPPTSYYQPTINDQDVESLIWACATLEDVPAEMVVRLAVATTYGGRLGELVTLSSEDLRIDGNKSSLFLQTLKGGQRKPQPIPESLIPLFDIPLTPMQREKLNKAFKRLCRRAGVILPPKGGFHSIRRRVVTTVAEVEHSDLNVHGFMRWSVPRQFSMLARYKQTPTDVTDKEILDKHPYVKLWEEASPYILEHNSSYQLKPHILT